MPDSAKAPCSPEPEIRIFFSVFGLTFALETNETSLASDLKNLCPPYSSWTSTKETPDKSFRVMVSKEGVLVQDDNEWPESFSSTEDALEAVRGRIEFFLSCRSKERIFVHAGAVALDGAGLVFPGQTMAGKSTLVKELSLNGCLLYSDEFAVFDQDGLLHPFPRMMSLRTSSGQSLPPVHHEQLGIRAGLKPIPLSIVLAVRYKRAAHWEISQMSPGETLAELMTNTASARDNPIQVMNALRKACTGTIGLKGVRGEASEAIETLRRFLRSPR